MSEDARVQMQWMGADQPCLDQPQVHAAGGLHIGAYGGRTQAGAWKNEDGALCWADHERSWEFAMLLDGHNTSESVRLVMDTVASNYDTIVQQFSLPTKTAFSNLQNYILEILSTIDTTDMTGETSCLLFARKGSYLWWMCVGDCVLYLFHPDYARLGQFEVNQRNFFEWVGEVNTFDEEVPCYTAGVKRLRTGRNVIFAVTDGVLENGSRSFESPAILYQTVYASTDLPSQIDEILRTVHLENGVDSATVISWEHICESQAPYPSNMPKSR